MGRFDEMRGESTSHNNFAGFLVTESGLDAHNLEVGSDVAEREIGKR
jgi:hypothetical protein